MQLFHHNDIFPLILCRCFLSLPNLFVCTFTCYPFNCLFFHLPHAVVCTCSLFSYYPTLYDFHLVSQLWFNFYHLPCLIVLCMSLPLVSQPIMYVIVLSLDVPAVFDPPCLIVLYVYYCTCVILFPRILLTFVVSHFYAIILSKWHINCSCPFSPHLLIFPSVACFVSLYYFTSWCAFQCNYYVFVIVPPVLFSHLLC